jgi:Xaa-Pro aminopeptidase
VTIGAVKTRINLKLAENGIVDAEGGTIFAQGRDAGIPHSRGRADQALRLGQTIVFDIFPAEPGGGYFYDFTRTWCLGHASDEVQGLYAQVREIYQKVMAALKLNAPTADYQRMTTDFFEGHGHPTIASQPGTHEGYVHSLGHGIGLQIHEAPSLSARSTERLTAGMVFSVEPGLYYPSRGLGLRLEDSVWLNPATRACEVLAPYPDDLIIPIRKR